MKNLITGWVTTILGLIIMVAACLDFFGVIVIPAPEGVTEMHQVGLAFIVGFALFLIPKSFFEDTLKKIITKKTDNV